MDNEKLIKELLKEYMNEIPTFSDEIQKQVHEELEKAIQEARESIAKLEKDKPQQDD